MKNSTVVCRILIWAMVKFMYSEKATKFCKISNLLLSVCTVDKSKVVSFRTSKFPLFPKPVSWLGLFWRFLRQTGSSYIYGVFQFLRSKFIEGSEILQDCLQKSDQNFLRILILTDFYWSSFGILSDCTRNSGGKSMRLQLMKITYPHILFHPNGWKDQNLPWDHCH